MDCRMEQVLFGKFAEKLCEILTNFNPHYSNLIAFVIKYK